ncbi:MAG: hypothetical protein A2231_09845 [Candidatus Firestonebacteria bacterium RIFOXYA2_FULL_40_8]|nr:MAG: hypothetical protein A2231_09845 [Candidatus Firestonebacteria bacterium RIFOXYA2_FULL_40_8]
MSNSTPKKTNTDTFKPILGARFSGHPLNPDFPVDFTEKWSPPNKPIQGLFYHDSFELGLCHEGSGVLILDNKAIPYKAGDICAIRQFDSHFHIGTKNTKTVWSFIYFDPVRLLKAALKDPELADTSGLAAPNLNPILSSSEHPKIEQVYLIFYNELLKKTKGYHDASVSLASIFLTLLNRIKTSSLKLSFNVYGEDMNRIAPVLFYIGKYYSGELSVNNLSMLCGMSTRNFTRKFTEVTGKPPMIYVNEIRIAMAKTELLSTNKKIIEIAFDNGFASISNFGKSFIKQTGFSPRHFKKNNTQQ